ncbi:MAG: thioesterase family protein [Anaerolineae bacterium]|nr:thioesterase family protein [Anaerolineae bacterium]
MRPPQISLDLIQALPMVYRAAVPEHYRDLMGHMNIRYYLEIYDEAGIPLFERIGLSEAHYRANQAGGFDLEHHIHYLNEVHIGDEVLLYARLLDRSAKRLHYMLFMVNQTRGLLASTFECVNSYADLRVRRTAPYPPAIAAQIDSLLDEHTRLAWAAPTCGSMSS